MYTINATTGALTSTGTINGNCPGLCFPSSVVVDPSGKFAYVASGGGGFPYNVEMYTINATTGALTSIGTIAAGTDPVSVAVDPSGKFAYVVNAECRIGWHRVHVRDQRHDRGFNIYGDDSCGDKPCLRSRGSIWQVRLRDEFRHRTQRVHVHHRRHDRGLNIDGDDRRRNTVLSP